MAFPNKDANTFLEFEYWVGADMEPVEVAMEAGEIAGATIGILFGVLALLFLTFLSLIFWRKWRQNPKVGVQEICVKEVCEKEVCGNL